MTSFTTPAIMLRRIDFGDYDLIVTFYTFDRGKVTAIAKAAKKSKKRFAGILELFSLLNIAYTSSRGGSLPVLQEASLISSYYKIRVDIKKTAYASYWAELINSWAEDNEKNAQLFILFKKLLFELDLGRVSDETLSIVFQIRFLKLAGICPDLSMCSACKRGIEDFRSGGFFLGIKKGSLVCKSCMEEKSGGFYLSAGTVKQLLWIEKGSLKKALRIKLTTAGTMESQRFLEKFVPYHTEKELKSLNFLRQIRR